MQKKIFGLLGVVLFIVIFYYGNVFFRSRISAYRYDVKTSYLYDFSSSHITSLPISINGDQFSPPIEKLKNENSTVFLGIQISSTFIGKVLEPSIQWSCGSESYTQAFERGAKGKRYINLSFPSCESLTEISFAPSHMEIGDQTGELFIFQDKPVDTPTIVVIAPHPDDAELAAYGLYSGNPNSYIITLTAGEAGPSKYRELFAKREQQYREKGRLRVWNSITVPMLGGISPERSINLGFFDGTLKTMYENQGQPVSSKCTGVSELSYFRGQNLSPLTRALPAAKADWATLVDDLASLLTTIKPDIIVTPYPALDGHKDHEYGSVAVFSALKKTGITSGELYLYTNHFPANNYYPFGTEHDVMSLPPSFNGELYFERIFSLPLNELKQNHKFLALDAMNDLRADPDWRTFSGAWRQLTTIATKKLKGRKMDYYDRAIRSNELFLAISVRSIYDEKIIRRVLGPKVAANGLQP